MGRLFGETIDLDSPTLARLTDDVRIARQAVRLILSTRFASLWYAPEAGRDVREYVNLGIDARRLTFIPIEVKNAIEADERFARAVVSAVPTFTANGSAALRLTIDVFAKGAEDVPIPLVALASADLVKVIVRGL